VLAKWDLIADPGAKLREFVELAERMLPQLRGAPVVALSAETGRGLDRLMPAVLKAHGDWDTRLKTRDLNDWLQLAVQRHPPPATPTAGWRGGGRPPPPRGGTGRGTNPKSMPQTRPRPPPLVLSPSRADKLPDSYRRYLINSLRESFDLPGTPIRITIKSGRN